MLRKIQRTFDWEMAARYLAAAAVLYVLVGVAVTHEGTDRRVPVLRASLISG